MDNYQTDFGGWLRKDGCLFFDILKASTEITGVELSREDVLGIAEHLYNYGAMMDENSLSKKGAFIWNHEGVFNTTLTFMRTTTQIKYTGRIYMPWEEERGEQSFGKRGGDILILQIETITGAGHFRLPNWDPWEPGTTMVDLKSLRFYKVVK